jgi:flagellar export protein FliJ
MKRFEFPLETARRWRLEQQDLEEMKLRQIAAELQQIVLRRKRLDAEYAHSESLLRSAPTVVAEDFVNLENFRRYLRKQTEALDQARAQCEKRIEAQRARVLDARRKFELLEHLKKRKREDWRLESLKEEETLASELFLAKWNREP